MLSSGGGMQMCSFGQVNFVRMAVFIMLGEDRWGYCTRWRSFFVKSLFTARNLKNEDIHSFHDTDTPLVSKWIDNEFCEKASEEAAAINQHAAIGTRNGYLVGNLSGHRGWQKRSQLCLGRENLWWIIVPTLSEASNAEPIAALLEASSDDQNGSYLIKHLWGLRSTNGKMSQHRWILDRSLKAMKTWIWRIVISNTLKFSPQYNWRERCRVRVEFFLFGFDKCLWELSRIISIWDVRVPSTVVICHHSYRPIIK